jgi:hypothetical protein
LYRGLLAFLPIIATAHGTRTLKAVPVQKTVQSGRAFRSRVRYWFCTP